MIKQSKLLSRVDSPRVLEYSCSEMEQNHYQTRPKDGSQYLLSSLFTDIKHLKG
jgi:hypothetical protein